MNIAQKHNWHVRRVGHLGNWKRGKCKPRRCNNWRTRPLRGLWLLQSRVMTATPCIKYNPIGWLWHNGSWEVILNPTYSSTDGMNCGIDSEAPGGGRNPISSRDCTLWPASWRRSTSVHPGSHSDAALTFDTSWKLQLQVVLTPDSGGGKSGERHQPKSESTKPSSICCCF